MPVRCVAYQSAITLCSVTYMYTFGNAGTGSTYRNDSGASSPVCYVTRPIAILTWALLFLSQATQLTVELPRPPSSASSYPHHNHSPSRSTRNLTQRWRTCEYQRSSKPRRTIHHVDREYAFHQRSGQGQRRRAPLVPALLVRTTTSLP